MIVPKHWAEARDRRRIDERYVTLRRFGWSDESPEAAKTQAEQRVREAFDAFGKDPSIARRDAKVPYNGAEGVPIREEIVETHGDVVVTRNSYGAKCLNTPDVLFADVDFEPKFPGCVAITPFVLSVWLVGFSLAFGLDSWSLGLGTFLLGPFVGAALQRVVVAFTVGVRGGPRRVADRRIDAWARANPEWHLRVYETPVGLRVLATHTTFDATSPLVARFFAALDVDPLYRRMCERQRCFRARLTAKPWRIGISAHMKPRPGVWPVRPERLLERRTWLDDYDRKAAEFSACRFVREVGSGRTCDAAARTVALHDDACGARLGKPLA